MSVLDRLNKISQLTDGWYINLETHKAKVEIMANLARNVLAEVIVDGSKWAVYEEIANGINGAGLDEVEVLDQLTFAVVLHFHYHLTIDAVILLGLDNRAVNVCYDLFTGTDTV